MLPPPHFNAALADIIEGIHSWRLWLRFGWQDVRRRYRRTAFGPFWTTLSLGFFVVALGIVWSHIWKQELRTYMPYLTSGMLPWVLLQAMISESCGVFSGAEGLIKQMRLSYATLVLTLIWRNLILFLHNMVIFVAVAVWAGVNVSWNTLLVLPGLLLLVLNATWIAFLVGLLCTRFRDVTQVVGSFLQIVMFVTPIFFAADSLKGKLRVATDFNLIYHLVDLVRSPLLGKAPALYSYAFSITVLLLGWALAFYIFSCFRRRVSYWV